MGRKMFRFGAVWVCLAFLWACGGGSGSGGGDDGDNGSDDFTIPERSLVSADPTPLMKATPDECYVAVDEVGHWEKIDGLWQYFVDGYTRYNDVPPNVPDAQGVCADTQNLGEIPKTNQAYVWGMALAGDRLWLGTGANVRCLVQGGYLGLDRPAESDSGTGSLTEICEYGASWILTDERPYPVERLPDEFGDWRPPTIHYYDITAGLGTYHLEASLDPLGEQRLKKTLGLRSAGAIGDIVFLAGPDFNADGSRNVNVFAFRSSTADYLGSYVLENYSNIRKWKEIGGHLYAVLSVANETVTGNRYGHVLKWVGTPGDPFNTGGGPNPFAVVGRLPGGGAELSEYGSDRMAVATWPGGIDEAGIASGLDIAALEHAGIYISVPLGGDGLSPSSADTNFTEAFTYDQYDPDLVRAFTYGGGALAYFDGWLIWGSMHVPGTNYLGMSLVYGGLFDIPMRNSTCRNVLDPDDTCEDLAGGNGRQCPPGAVPG